MNEQVAEPFKTILNEWAEDLTKGNKECYPYLMVQQVNPNNIILNGGVACLQTLAVPTLLLGVFYLEEI